MYKFSVAIPTFNSSEFLKECIYGFKESKYLNEIIICDDNSDTDEVNRIKKIIHESSQQFDFEIKLIENENNLGAFKNKYKLIEYSKNEWIYQIDSDNVPFTNIDKVIKDIYENPDKNKNIYYPSKLIQFWKYKKLAHIMSKFQKKYIVKFSNELSIFDKDNTKKAIEEFLNYDTSRDRTKGSPEIKSEFLLDKHIYWVLNCGNFIVNKNQFLLTMKPGLDFERKILSMDAVAFSYLWLKNEGSIVLHPDLAHFHRKRFNSVSYIEKEDSKESRDFFTNKILKL